MRSPRALITILAAATLAVTLAACTGGAGAGDADYTDSPLGKMLWGKQLGISAADIQADSAAKNKKLQQLVAECMTKEGFEYTLDDASQSGATIPANDWKPDDKEWVATYGYGVVDSPGRTDAPTVEYVDPNQAYLDSLSESERNSFYETLNGPPLTEDEMAATQNGEGAQWDWRKGGCQGKAQHEVWGDMSGAADEKFADLNAAIGKLYERLPSDAAVAKLNAAWAKCMDEQGEGGFTTQPEPQASVSEKLAEAQSEIDAEQATQADYGPTNPKVKAVQQEEVRVALIDLDCRTKTNYRQELLKRQFELEEQFIKEHKAELDAYKAYLEQQ